MKLRMLLTTAGVAVGAAACHHAPPAAVTPVQAPARPAATNYGPSRDGGTAGSAVHTEVMTNAGGSAFTAWGIAAADSSSLADRIHFGFDSTALSQEDLQQLEAKRQVLARDPSLKIQIAGNCDERGSDEYNLALGERRAAAAKRWLESYGIAAERISITSYGKERPLDQGHDESAWAANRRDDFLVLTH